MVKVGGSIRARKFMCRLTVEGISGTQRFDNGNICFTECVSPVCGYLTSTLIGKIARSKDGTSSSCQRVVSMIEFMAEKRARVRLLPLGLNYLRPTTVLTLVVSCEDLENN